jgi:hypothetical protein
MRVSGGRRVRFQVAMVSGLLVITLDWVGTRVWVGGALDVMSISFHFGPGKHTTIGRNLYGIRTRDLEKWDD